MLTVSLQSVAAVEVEEDVSDGEHVVAVPPPGVVRKLQEAQRISVQLRLQAIHS